MKYLKILNLMHSYAFLGFLAIYFWFISGHRCQIAALQITSAYVGFEYFNVIISTPLLFLNTLFSYIIIILVLPFFHNYAEYNNNFELSEIIK